MATRKEAKKVLKEMQKMDSNDLGTIIVASLITIGQRRGITPREVMQECLEAHDTAALGVISSGGEWKLA